MLTVAVGAPLLRIDVFAAAALCPTRRAGGVGTAQTRRKVAYHVSTIAERPAPPTTVPGRVPAPVSPAPAGAGAATRAEPATARTEVAPSQVAGRDVRAIVAAYLALTKPRIIELLLVTTVPAMMLAADGWPSLWLVAAVLLGGSLAAGAANAFNCYIDRDIDQIMRRTARRPIPRHTVSPRSALVFGLVLAAVSTVIMAAFTNWLATALTLASIVYYDLVYTLWLKRTTAQNTFWGGICGATPVLIGWAAVTGSLSPAACALFAVVFFWQMPHFYALAIRYKDDYARAGIPMLPVVASQRRVTFEIVAFSWLTLVASIAAWPFGLGRVYGATAVVLGGLFVVEAHRLRRRAARGAALRPMRLFHWSTTYLTVLFVAVALDALL